MKRFATPAAFNATLSAPLPTEIDFDTFCKIYLDALEEDERRVERLPERPLGEAVTIPLGDDDHSMFDRLVAEQEG